MGCTDALIRSIRSTSMSTCLWSAITSTRLFLVPVVFYLTKKLEHLRRCRLCRVKDPRQNHPGNLYRPASVAILVCFVSTRVPSQ
eukprot:755508-Hanusia_phi.AAC.1